MYRSDWERIAVIGFGIYVRPQKQILTMGLSGNYLYVKNIHPIPSIRYLLLAGDRRRKLGRVNTI